MLTTQTIILSLFWILPMFFIWFCLYLVWRYEKFARVFEIDESGIFALIFVCSAIPLINFIITAILMVLFMHYEWTKRDLGLPDIIKWPNHFKK